MAGELKVKASRIGILSNNLTLNLLEGSHEMELPEGANIQGSRGILIFPSGAFLYFGSSRFLVGTIKGLPSLTLDEKGEGRV
jgi:hypothetical protein